MATTEIISSTPRIHRFWIKWPAPGMNHARAGTTTDIVVMGVAAVAALRDLAGSTVFVGEFAI
jgi:hypothetical protein